MKTATEIQNELPQFYGSIEWHRFSILHKNVLLTDGAKYIADSCEAYWLFDVIASYLSRMNEEGITIVKLIVKDKTAQFFIEDILTQEIEFTDFPLDEIEFYVGYDGEFWTICLPSEN